ncbi:hypothetical protein V8D89_007615 [Ganoderma adspersum]
MMPNDTWPADVKNAEDRIDPNVLPEYTLLPSSPPQSAVSYNESPGACASNDVGSSSAASAANLNADTVTADSAPTPTCGTESLRIVKLLYVGMLALAIPPVFLSWMGLAMGAVVLYGCGKILEGIGRALAFVPEALYRQCVARRAKKFWRAVGENGAAAREGQQGEEIVVEGQVALEDVEAGQGGPISI